MKQLRTWVMHGRQELKSAQYFFFFFQTAAVSHCMLKKFIYCRLIKLCINDLKLKLRLLG